MDHKHPKGFGRSETVDGRRGVGGKRKKPDEVGVRFTLYE
jgi:hypothetical protein